MVLLFQQKMRLRIERKQKSQSSPYSKMIRTSSKKQTHRVINYETWRTSRSDRYGKSFRSLSKSLKNEKNLKTLLGNISQLRSNVNFSHRLTKMNNNNQSSERDLLIKSIDLQQSTQEPVCQITVKIDATVKRFNHKAATTNRLLSFLKEKFQDVEKWKSYPQNIPLDYFLSIQNNNISFLNGQSITLEPYETERQKKVNINSFDVLHCIGTGGFSKVFLCRFKQNGRFYAMKVIDKNFIVKNKKKKIVLNQKKIMEKLKHPFIIEMKFAFESKSSLIFILEFCPGGELFGLVKKFRIMSENIARFYMAQILLGLEEIHKNGIVYRDFKPENILIGMDGHIKIADFGLAKPNISNMNQRAYSFCGSPEYMPPQMILKKGHSLPVDFYCLGALLFELVTGLPPFYSENPNQIFQGTLSKDIVFPNYAKISEDLKQLLKGLLCKDEGHRLGTFHGVREVLEHPWFRKTNFESYYSKEIEAPIKFTGLKDLKLIFEEMKIKNKQYIEEILAQQKNEGQKNFELAMDKFYFDYRQRRSDRFSYNSRKENGVNRSSTTSRPSTRAIKMQEKSIKNILSHRSLTGNNQVRKNKITTRYLDINLYLR